MKQVNKYIDDVLTGKIITGELVKLAVQRHLEDLDKDWDYVFDGQKAKQAIEFAQRCRHWKGEKAGELIVLEPHQQFYFASIFGWVHKKTGFRRFRTSYKEVGRKNAKTTECAVKACYHLLADKEAGAQCYFVATKEDQARIAFKDATEIIKITPGLNSRFNLFTKSIVYKSSFMKPLGSDSNTQDGFDPSYGIIDEYHAHKDDKMLNVIESGMGARRQPLIDIITTAGFNKAYPCYSSLRKSCIDILRGIKQDDETFALIFTLDEDDDWEDQSMWIKANPNLDVSVKMSYLMTRFTKAKNQGGSKEVDFKTKNLNIWTDVAEVWIPDAIWIKGKKDISKDSLLNQPCYGGLDLAKGIDLNAFALFFPDTFSALLYFWIPEYKANNHRDGVDYIKWANDGHIKITSGNIIDHRQIVFDIKEIISKYDFQSLAFDRFLSHHGVIQDLIDEKIECHELGQGFISLSEPTKELERLAYSGELNHFGNPILRWMASNAVRDINPAGAIKLNKAKSENKIDGLAALINAIGEWMTFRNEQKGSVYDNKGITMI